MNHKAKYVIEVSEGKFLKSIDGNGVSVTNAENARRFRTTMEAEIFANVHGGIELLCSEETDRSKGFPKIVED